MPTVRSNQLDQGQLYGTFKSALKSKFGIEGREAISVTDNEGPLKGSRHQSMNKMCVWFLCVHNMFKMSAVFLFPSENLSCSRLDKNSVQQVPVPSAVSHKYDCLLLVYLLRRL